MSQARRTQFPAWVVVLVLSALTIITFSVLLIMGTLKILPEPPYAPEDPFVLYGLTAFNFVAFVIFAFILARLLIRLRQERRARRLGSRLKARLVRHFIIISILPLVSLGFFSYLFINVTIDKWFGAPYQNVLHDSQYIYDQYVEDEKRDLQQMTDTLRALLEAPPSGQPAPLRLPSLVTENPKITWFQVVDGSGQVLAAYTKEPPEAGAVGSALAEARARLRAGQEFTQTLPGQNEKAFVLVTAAPFTTHGGGILTIYRPRPELAERAANIALQHERYEILHRNQGKIRRTTFQVLGLITFLLLFAATWTASHLAKGITLPVQALAEATRKVARGDFDQSVECLAEDELDLLIKSFNRMIGQLKENREQLETTAERLRQTNLTLDERRRYIETVLESLSTGIISVDSENRITTINRAAARILHLRDTPSEPATLAESLAPVLSDDNTQRILRLIQKATRTGFATADVELETLAGVSHVVVSASALRDEQGRLQGLVIMLEDVTELVRAQRQTVWSEVARRMAHEIKNPLTPIQLSAERIARNVTRHQRALDERSRQIIDE
jgi:PAS domain S-box-containing protein